MGKKIIIFVFTLLLSLSLLLFLSTCGTPSDWKEIEIENYGYIKAPANWELCFVDGFAYIYRMENDEKKNVLVQYANDSGVNPCFSEIKDMVWILDENFSNSAAFSKKRICYNDGLTSEMFVLTFYDVEISECVAFICIDNSVSEDTVRTITKHFSWSKQSDKAFFDRLLDWF